jgi:hypothetical protein
MFCVGSVSYLPDVPHNVEVQAGVDGREVAKIDDWSRWGVYVLAQTDSHFVAIP